MKKKILLIPLALLLAISLVVTGCPAPAPPVEVPAEIAKLEKEVAAEKAKVAGLEKEIAELKAPVKVTKILLECIIPAHPWSTAAEYIAEKFVAATEGRYEVEIVWGEAIVPSADVLDAVRDGIFQLLFAYEGYWAEKQPVQDIQVYTEIALRSSADLWLMYEHWGWDELFDESYAEDWNAHRIATFGHEPSDNIFSTVPIPDLASIEGMKFRSYGGAAARLAAAGAGVVWMPGEEIYTAMASGLVVAASYAQPPTWLDMGWNEVSKYWLRDPPAAGVAANSLLVNMDFWNTLSVTDQELLTHITQFVAHEIFLHGVAYDIEMAYAKGEELGMVIVEWSAEDIEAWGDFVLPLAPTPKNARAQEALDQLFDYMRFKGYAD